MSKIITIAQAMKERIETLDLEGVTVVVDRQKDILSEIAKNTSKAGPLAVVILFEGFSNPDGRESGLPSVIRRYSVSLYAKPILKSDEQLPADDVLEQVAEVLHDWYPDEVVPGFVGIVVTGGDFRPDSKHLVYDLDIEVESRL
jgi:hypothetical protein